MGGLTEASLVVQIWICEVEVSMILSIVEFNGDSVVSILVDSPYKAR
jgi:hypothetical protein